MDTLDFLQKPIMNPPQKTFPLSMVPVYGEEGGTCLSLSWKKRARERFTVSR
jgi:hypothetical protein